MSSAAFFEYLLRLGDDRLVLGHRLSEWCGHGPILEEDIALANIALDLIGEATLLLKLAGQTEGKGRNEDALRISATASTSETR
jgi:ring-1,2-phenylacetyl-CoA epoxidase subunit PaaC